MHLWIPKKTANGRGGIVDPLGGALSSLHMSKKLKSIFLWFILRKLMAGLPPSLR
jgi:hypothetical protein